MGNCKELNSPQKAPETAADISAECLSVVRKVFGRTLPWLIVPLQVTRAELHSWLEGTVQPPLHCLPALQRLAEAARVFDCASVKPTTSTMMRTVSQGKTFLELIKEGHDGASVARTVVRLEKRADAAKAKLDALLPKAGEHQDGVPGVAA